MAQCTAKFVDVTVERVAVAWFVTLPHGNHQFRGVDCFSDTDRQPCSSSKNTRFILGQIGLGDYFDKISDGTNITRSKPDPEVFLKAAEYLGLEPKDCLVVEDAVAGIQAAIAAGMDSAAVGDAAKSNLATYRLRSFQDLLSCVE